MRRWLFTYIMNFIFRKWRIIAFHDGPSNTRIQFCLKGPFSTDGEYALFVDGTKLIAFNLIYKKVERI